jgi:hypothetical protein
MKQELPGSPKPNRTIQSCEKDSNTKPSPLHISSSNPIKSVRINEKRKFHVLVTHMILIYLCLFSLVSGAHDGPSIWEVGKFKGAAPEFNSSSVTPRMFYEVQQRIPFVVRGYQPTLNSLAEQDGFTGDSMDWLALQIGNETRMSTLEGELQETRLAPVIHKLKFKYFFERFRGLDVYAVTQAPIAIREHLQLLPFFSCGGNSFKMQTPMMWISGGIKQSKSVVHSDSHLNQHCILKGRKRFMLIPPSIPVDTPEYGWVYTRNEDGSIKDGYKDAYGDYAANINYDSVDLETYPKWRDIPWFLAELNAGDCLFMPIDWYHYVESEAEPTVSWHLWFHTPSEWKLEDQCLDNPENPPGIRIRTNQCIFSNDDQTSPVNRRTGLFDENRTSICTY